LSPAYKKITGYSPEDLVGKPVMELIHPDDFKHWSMVCCKNKTPDNTIGGTWRFMIRNGEWRWLDCSVTYFEKTPGNIRAVVISTDITERIHEEEKMKEIIRENELYLFELRERVTNNAVIIRTFVDFLMERFADDASKQIFIQAESRIRFCISLYEKFHTLPGTSGVNLFHYIQDIVDSITIITDEIKENIIISEKMYGIMINMKWVLPLGLVLNELISYAIKYACAGNSQGDIEISHDCCMDKITLYVCDRGKGFSGFVKDYNTYSMGVNLALKMAEMIGGELKLSDETESRCFLTFAP